MQRSWFPTVFASALLAAAPQAMRPDSFWEGGAPLPFTDARFSGLSAGVPGTVDTWDEALRRFGTMKLREALKPGIAVARKGFVVDQTFFEQTLGNVDFFDDVPSTEEIYLDADGTPRDVGTVLRNPDLARAYERIARKGAKGFYRGAIASAMVRAVTRPPIAADANHVWRPGVMTVRDVKRYVAPERAPTRIATSPVPPGDPYPYDTVGEASVTAAQSETTTHLTVADKWGNVVSYTFTIESTGGNGIVVPGWGFLLNNELTDFNFDSTTHPNRADGGKRPRSSMSPTIVTREGEPLLAVGSPGGSMIITTVLQVLLERLDLNATLPDAIARPRASQRNTAAVSAGRAFISSPEGPVLQSQYGHTFASPPPAEIGAVTGLEFLGNGRILAAAEPTRRGGG